jgi:protein TonB
MKKCIFTLGLLMIVNLVFAQQTGIHENEPVYKVQDTIGVAMPQYSLPKFKGGERAFGNYVLDRIVFPMRCKLAKINGKVMAKFVVNVDGKVSNVEIIEHNYLCPEFSKEAIKVIMQSPLWTPAMLDGKPVKCFQTIPIKFVVEEN